MELETRVPNKAPGEYRLRGDVVEQFIMYEVYTCEIDCALYLTALWLVWGYFNKKE